MICYLHHIQWRGKSLKQVRWERGFAYTLGRALNIASRPFGSMHGYKGHRLQNLARCRGTKTCCSESFGPGVSLPFIRTRIRRNHRLRGDTIPPLQSVIHHTVSLPDDRPTFPSKQRAIDQHLDLKRKISFDRQKQDP